jgi:hypothetical protein
MPDRDQLQWLVLKDFSAGIWQKTGLYGLGAAPPTGPLSSPAPLGAGTVETYGCIALPGGGLGPLPRAVGVSIDVYPFVGVDTFHVVGFDAFGPVAVGTPTYGPDELHIGIETNTAFKWLVVDAYDGSFNITVAHSISLPSSPLRWGMSFAHTRVNPTDPTQPGHPVVVTSWGRLGSNPGFVGWWPAEPGGSKTANIVSGRYGKVLGHQARLVLLETLAMTYVHPSPTFLTDDHISFTSPNNNDLGTQRQVFLPEYPSGYGAVGSVSAGELFMVKNDGGAVLVQGDISSPNLIRMPGVTPTGFVACKPAACQLGLVYYSNQLGAWLWRGEDTATKISYQLEDDFCYLSPFIGGVANEVVHFEPWGDWVLTSGGWLWDTRTQGWFRIHSFSPIRSQIGGAVPWRIARSVNGRFLYMAPYRNAVSIPLMVLDRNGLASEWQWESHPLMVSDPDLIMEIREFVVVAHGRTGAKMYIDVEDETQYGEVGEFPVPTQPGPIRLNFSFRSTSPRIRVIAYSDVTNDPAPILHELRIGYQLRRRIGTTVGV